ncbi:hypothetical protein Hdeb2414_s0017g00501461 [Helianthus debilis subsp. tardiflorus]
MVRILPMTSAIRPTIASFATARFSGSISVINASSRFNSVHFGSTGLVYAYELKNSCAFVRIMDMNRFCILLMI